MGLMDMLLGMAQSAITPPPKIGLVQPGENGGCGVSTVLTPDEGWETAIAVLANGEPKILPVERYATKEEAEAGHERWLRDVHKMKRVTMVGSSHIDVKDREYDIEPIPSGEKLQ